MGAKWQERERVAHLFVRTSLAFFQACTEVSTARAYLCSNWSSVSSAGEWMSVW